MRCSICDFENSGDNRFCGGCGASLTVVLVEGGISQQATLGDRPRRRPAAAADLIAGRYQVLRTLGHGGMGAVFLARDTKPGMGEREVAVKRILDADDQGVQRFLRESAAIAALQHPNIRAVFDRGEDEQGHYLVMEYVDGCTLHERVVQAGPLVDEAFLEVARGLARALSLAHRRGVIHRDVKPANVLVAEDGTPKLTDFGLARMGHDSDLSVTGYGMGTLDYASPEQRRDAKSADHRSDIYGLGATLYFAATGESPKTIRETRIPERWRAAVMKCLEERPENRYFSVDDLLRDLEAIRHGPAEARKGIQACAACGAENPEKASYCRGCGAALGRTCPSCGSKEPQGVAYCSGCGNPIGRAREEPADAKHLNPFGWEVLDETPGPQTGAAWKIRDPHTGIVFLLVEPGSFQMGSPAGEADRDSAETQHLVTLTKAFYLGETEVTQAQWERVMGSNPSHFKGDTLPVEQVSWEDCQEFCRKAGKAARLPTEAEWEYACRAGSTTRFCFGDAKGKLGDYAWYSSNSGGKTHPVSQRKPNAWGFKDMHGNVWEWCHDCYGDYPTRAVVDPRGAWGFWRAGHVLRGGSWCSNPRNCRSAFRRRYDPSFRSSGVGLRVARTL